MAENAEEALMQYAEVPEATEDAAKRGWRRADAELGLGGRMTWYTECIGFVGEVSLSVRQGPPAGSSTRVLSLCAPRHL